MFTKAVFPDLPDTFALHEGERRALQVHAAHEAGVPDCVFYDSLSHDALTDAPTDVTVGPMLVVIPAGTGEQGAAPHEPAPSQDRPRRVQVVPQPFALGQMPVTTAEFEVFAAATGWQPRPELAWLTGRQPVINVRYLDARAYCNWLSAQTGQRYRLPTEIEWEYACRAGAATAYPHGNTLAPTQAHYNTRASFDTERPRRPRLLSRCFLRCGAHEVGVLPPNCWNLYDMVGNVWELTSSAWTNDRASAAEPRARKRSPAVVTKGGSWFDGPEDCRAAARRRRLTNELDLNLGFRVLRELA